MTKKITDSQKIQINELYLIHKTYAAVSRIMGLSPSTIKKYITPNYISKKNIKKSLLTLEKIEAVETFLLPPEDIQNPNILKLTDEEVLEMQEFWKEILL